MNYHSFADDIGLTEHKFLSSVNFYIRTSLREAKRRRLYFCLAVWSTLIVVCATAISMTIIDYAPLIFVKTVEAKSASIDVLLRPSDVGIQTFDGMINRYDNKKLLLNTTAIRRRIEPIYPKVTSPRTEFSALFIAPGNSAACLIGAQPPYTECYKHSGKFLAQETQNEDSLGMGDRLPLPKEIPQDSVIISTKQARALNVQEGDTVVVEIDIKDLLIELMINFNRQKGSQEEMVNTLYIPTSIFYLTLTVEKILESVIGKIPDEDFGSTMIYEYKHLFKVIAQNLPKEFLSLKNAENFQAFLAVHSPTDYADQIIFNLKNRQAIYLDTNFDNIQSSVTKFASRISEELGVFPYEMELPVYDSLLPMRFGSLFLGVTLKMIIFILFILSVIVIYNLLMVTVETKTFEFGVIRMLGLNKLGIAQLVLIQALFFVIPGLILGVLLSHPLLNFISQYLEEKLHAEIPTYPTSVALFWSVIMGLLIPTVSSYYPMKEALGKNLNVSLDLLHSKTSSVHISIEVEADKIPWARITFAVIAIFYGLSQYLFLPLSLLTFELGLLLSIFFITLMGIFLGLTVLSLNFQYIVEKFVTRIFFFWASVSFRTLILKNLLAHKIRNRQTSVMYSLSLGFIIFITVSLNQEITNISYVIQARRGSLIQVTDTFNLDRSHIENHINTQLADIVEEYAWMTDDLNGFLVNKGYQGVTISHRGKLYNIPGRIFGVSPTVFQATLREYLKVGEADPESELDLGEQLYTARGSQSVIMGEYYREFLKLSLDPESTLMLTVGNGQGSRSEEFRVLATLNFAPGFRFSQIPLVTNQDIIISLPTYMRLAGDEIKKSEDIPLRKLFIKVKDNSVKNLEHAYESLSKFRELHYPGLAIWDIRDIQNSLAKSETAITVIFISIEAIVMILSLFSLITSMSTNILEQSKEIAVLRSIGVTRKMINYLYVAEGFVLVFSSAMFGIMIGTVIGWTISVQRVLFTQLPVEFVFPYRDTITVLIIAVLSSLASSYLPAKRITDMQIGKIMRHGA